MYVHPQRDSTGAMIGAPCESHLFSYGTPTRPETGDPIYDEVAVYLGADPY